MNNSPIVIVEDDKDDCQLLLDVFRQIGVKNPFRCFEHPVEAIDYLRSTSELPFIIISDINLPRMDGIAFKRVINQDTQILQKKIPFVFLSTSKANSMIEQAFNLSVQGYFQKPDDVESLKEIARVIVEYWKHSSYNFVNITLDQLASITHPEAQTVCVRPLTQAMHRILQDAIDRENTKRRPLGINHSQQCKGLVSRGMMSFDKYELNGKSFMGFHLTEEGRDYINHYNASKGITPLLNSHQEQTS